MGRMLTGLKLSFWFLLPFLESGVILACFNHSLETRAEPAVLRTCVENQAIQKPILLYRASKCKQTKEQGSKDCLWNHIFTFLCDCCQLFFFFCQDANKIGSNCAIIGCNLLKKHKLALYKTQSRELNHVDYKFFFNILLVATCLKT